MQTQAENAGPIRHAAAPADAVTGNNAYPLGNPAGSETQAQDADVKSTPVKPLPPEVGGRPGPEPTRYGDWEKNGRCIDF